LKLRINSGDERDDQVTATIRIGGVANEVVPEDLAALLRHCGSLLTSTFVSLNVLKPSVVSRSSPNDLLVLDLGGRLVGMKRCAGNPLYVKREAIVHRLRILGGMKNYSVRTLTGLRLRQVGTDTNCQPFQGWETSELVLMDFGAFGARKNFFDLVTSDVEDINRFFEKYGEWCAFDYIIGTRDRHPRNYVYDKPEGSVYSVDNEERPYDAGLNFTSFDSELLNFNRNAQKFIPPTPESRKEAILAFGRGFLGCWDKLNEKFVAVDLTADAELNRLGAATDTAYVKAVLSQRQAAPVLSGISLQ
jgi:hypothetical protein